MAADFGNSPITPVDLDSARFRDQVVGCWMGKNAGGTLGAPVEQVLAEPEPLHVTGYPELPEGGLPNDDLEMQLFWLRCVEERGIDFTSRDLARYWVDNIGYNWDEYGLSKTNLRRGLEPPISGNHNNWFRDCMGCPIRSEIWACIAPGNPRLAARFALRDALTDHAGGESVHGELFNAALESAAFVVSDRDLLLDIALSYVPEGTRTRAAIEAARAAHADGVDWVEARRRVIAAAPHRVAQYSPANLGFQVIGFLYGKDFGDSLLITVNCGWDTDSSGAAIGSYEGLLAGEQAIPDEWAAPLGRTIATNESWGGVRGGLVGERPVPADLDELYERIRHVAAVLRAHEGAAPATLADLYCDQATIDLVNRSPWVLTMTGQDVEVGVDYGTLATYLPGASRAVTFELRNLRAVPLEGELLFDLPSGWSGTTSLPVELGVGEVVRVAADFLTAHDPSAAEVTPQTVPTPGERIGVRFQCSGRPEGLRDSFVLLRAQRSELTLPNGTVEPVSSEGYELQLDEWIRHEGSGHYRVRTILATPEAVDCRLTVDSNRAFTSTLRGEALHQVDDPAILRPGYYLDAPKSLPVHLDAGTNELVIEFDIPDDDQGLEMHVLVMSDDEFRNGQAQVHRAIM